MPSSTQTSSRDGRETLVWYVTYGSNMHAARFTCYLSGGSPPGGARTYPGCRDSRPARDARAVWLPGQMYFALESDVWGGGMAFYDPGISGPAAARAYLVTTAQFADLVAQEMHREPDEQLVLDLDTILSTGRSELGGGRYETLILAGWLDSYPMLTFTAPWSMADATPTPPSGAYLKMLGEGLCETHAWTAAQAAEYLAGRPGARGNWDPATLEALLTGKLPAKPLRTM
jgi:hypothetical protein